MSGKGHFCLSLASIGLKYPNRFNLVFLDIWVKSALCDRSSAYMNQQRTTEIKKSNAA